MRRVGMNGGARSHAPRHLARCARPRATAVPLANPRRCRPSFQARGLSACAGVTPCGGTHSMLRLALLCHLSVAGALRLANNLECLPYEANEVFLDLSGARATAFPKGISQLTARLWRRLGVAAQQFGQPGWEGRVYHGFEGARLRGQDARRRVLDGYGCVGPGTQAPKGSASPCTGSRVRSLWKRHRQEDCRSRERRQR